MADVCLRLEKRSECGRWVPQWQTSSRLLYAGMPTMEQPALLRQGPPAGIQEFLKHTPPFIAYGLSFAASQKLVECIKE